MSDLKWKVLHSEYIYRDHWFTARKDRCKTPKGKIIDPYYVLEFPDWVNAVALTADDQVILVRQYRHAYGETILEIPGGCIDDTDASPQAAMQRELLEETGYAFAEMDYLGAISPNPSTNNNTTYMYLARGGRCVQAQQLDHNEEIEVVLLPVSEVRKLLLDNQIVQSLHATCLFYAFMKLGIFQ